MTPASSWELSVSEHRQMTELVVMLRSLVDDPSTDGLCGQLRAMIDEHVQRERRDLSTLTDLDELADATGHLGVGRNIERVAAALARHVEAQEHHPDRQIGDSSAD